MSTACKGRNAKGDMSISVWDMFIPVWDMSIPVWDMSIPVWDMSILVWDMSQILVPNTSLKLYKDFSKLPQPPPPLLRSLLPAAPALYGECWAQTY